jgi:hypothetical protein
VRAQAEAQLDECVRALSSLTGLGPATWTHRLTGRLADRRQQAQDAVHQQEPLTHGAAVAHEEAVAAMNRAQAATDALPEAREEAIGSLTGPAADEARRLLATADELAAAIHTASRAYQVTAGVDTDLATAGRWSVYDTYLGGGMVSSGMKQDAVYAANDKAASLTELLTSLREELQALRAPTSFFAVQMNDLVASIDLDMWWDNVFTDFLMHQRIDQAQDRVERLQEGLIEVAEALGEQRMALLAQVDALISTMPGAPKSNPQN